MISDYLIASLRLAIPLTFAALGGMYSERSGVLNIALEGMMLTGAFTGASVTFYTGNPWLGVTAALLTGGLVGLLHAFLSITLYVDQLVSGLAINLVAAGFTSFLARLVFNGSSTQRLPGIEPIIMPGLADIPILGALLFQQDILVYFLLAVVLASIYVLYHTSFGLTLRAVGEYPQAAATSGVSVAMVRYCAVILSGCLASLGGAYLALVQVQFFSEGMSAGKGFIAIAAVIFGRWHPLGISLACLLFGGTEALQLRIQGLGVNIPYQFLVMLPYAIALFALLGLAGKSTPPKSLGVTYLPDNPQNK
ncbi:ABC transporter permease [Anabaena sp. CA = ATCC 33047]|uniref:ABC transporter permease n=1 Tax=Anabaena sp. (strain CA / ATCC 33047) TaxID=52271 RepID=UPI00082FF993|nr:ABC transporter permease [Anabaena sp. CA = ATCC 33047]